jgi:hypothetical protein
MHHSWFETNSLLLAKAWTIALIANQQWFPVENHRKPTTGIEPVTTHLQGECSAN